MTDRERLIELIDYVLKFQPWGEIGYHTSKEIADHLLANGVIVPPCKVGDTVYIKLICGLKEDNSPIFEMKQGRVYEMRIDNGEHTKLWIGANFGVLHCCRPYTDFCFSKEQAEEKLRERNTKND